MEECPVEYLVDQVVIGASDLRVAVAAAMPAVYEGADVSAAESALSDAVKAVDAALAAVEALTA